MKKRILNILFWSILSAAFIGPGTITTAAKAGANYQFGLLWALVFSTIACIVLQEAAARLSIISDKSLGTAITETFGKAKNGWLVFILVIGAIIIGSAAYQTGNLLGAAEGILLNFNIKQSHAILALAILAGFALLFPSLQILARLLGLLVVLMGFAFITTAILLKPNISSIVLGSVIPQMPEGSGLLILGLIGTTVVPYNIFLGSGITDKTQSIKEMRFGITVAIILGGLTSMAVLIVGSSISGEFTYAALGQTLGNKLGSWAVWFFGFGLFAAGFSSSITAPLASAITARDLFQHKNQKKWTQNGIYFKSIWGLVLISGLGFGLAGFKPIPAIIAAQALNGLILPFISIFLWFAINNSKLIGKSINSKFQNLLFGSIVWVSLILGLWNVLKSGAGFFDQKLPDGSFTFYCLFTFTLLITIFVARCIKKINENA